MVLFLFATVLLTSVRTQCPGAIPKYAIFYSDSSCNDVVEWMDFSGWYDAGCTYCYLRNAYTRYFIDDGKYKYEEYSDSGCATKQGFSQSISCGYCDPYMTICGTTFYMKLSCDSENLPTQYFGTTWMYPYSTSGYCSYSGTTNCDSARYSMGLKTNTKIPPLIGDNYIMFKCTSSTDGDLSEYTDCSSSHVTGHLAQGTCNDKALGFDIEPYGTCENSPGGDDDDDDDDSSSSDGVIIGVVVGSVSLVFVLTCCIILCVFVVLVVLVLAVVLLFLGGGGIGCVAMTCTACGCGFLVHGLKSKKKGYEEVDEENSSIQE